MKVAVLGGTGFIGKHIVEELVRKGHQVEVWTRFPADYLAPSEQAVAVQWPLDESQKRDIEAVINLAGETINQRWTAVAKRRIMESRVNTTYHLLELVKKRVISPQVVINGSAIGYYGTSQDKRFSEEAATGSDFLAQVVAAWEKTADQFNQLNVRLIKLRIGLVLGKDGGALPKMLLPYHMFIGGRVGSGKQWISWIHIQDLVQIIEEALTQPHYDGTYNAVAPEPVTMQVFGQTIGQVLKRPHWFPVPGFALKMLLGEMSTLLLQGQYVKADKLQQANYRFSYPTLNKALEELLVKGDGKKDNKRD